MNLSTIVWKTQKRLDLALTGSERSTTTGTWSAGREFEAATLEGAAVVVSWKNGSVTAYPLADVDHVVVKAAVAAKAGGK